jgi:hypothetical protein
MNFDRQAATTAVFSHPNHELAIFGFLQEFRPSLVYLTDGGGEDRVAQTREGLERIGLLDRAHFLDYSEKSFYDALIARDGRFFAEVAARLAGVLSRLRPARVLCDAVEFYNPVHDLSLPIVRAALHALPDAEVYEVPLVYQKPAEAETYEIQRPVGESTQRQIEFPVASEHVDEKVRARDQVYTLLTAQLGSVITGIPRDHLAREVIFAASPVLPEPDSGKVLRYERRARILLERGEIEQMITYRGHFLPVAASLTPGTAASVG